MLDDLDALSDLDQLQSRYEILGELGRDGACVVYRGRSRRSDREVAVKLTSIPQSSSARSGARLGWQVHAMDPLHHSNLLGLSAVHHFQGGALALAMEHEGRPTLAEVIRRIGPLPLPQVEIVLRDVAGVLAYLHRSGIVHRGVSPHSIFLDRERRRALLAHFGIDRAGERDPAAEHGALARAFAYLAPEQIEGRTRADGAALCLRSDLYSLGLVGYAMLTGRQPWEGESLDGVIGKQKSEPLPPLAALRPDVPEHLCRAIEGALEKKPARRWRSAEEFLRQLDPDSEVAGPAPATDWMALLAELQGRVGERLQESAGALGRGLSEYRVPRGTGKLALGATSLVAAVVALSTTQPSSPTAADRPMPAIVVVPPSPSSEVPPASPPASAEDFPRSTPPPSPERIVVSRSREPVAAGAGASRMAAADPAVQGARTVTLRKSPIPLLGEPVPPGDPVHAAGIRSRVPPLLGTLVQPVAGGRATDSASPVGPGGGSRR